MSPNSNFDRFEEKLDNLVEITHSNKIEILDRIDRLSSSHTERIHALEMKVDKHDGHFSLLGKLTLGSGLVAGLFAYFKDNFFK